MRIVIDLQGAQSIANRNREIGRDTLAFTRALARNRGQHEIFIVLNGRFEDTILPIRNEFRGLIPADQIHVWHTHGQLSQFGQGNAWWRDIAEITREAAIASLEPSVVLITSLFEGLNDDAVTSIGTLGQACPTAVIVFEFPPKPPRSAGNSGNPAFTPWRENKLKHLGRADLILTTSEPLRREGITQFGLSPESVVDISIDAKMNESEQQSPSRVSFWWDESAARSIDVLATLNAQHIDNNRLSTRPVHRPRLAFVSPLPPARSGIADYSAELLPELARHYEIDVIVDQEIVDQPRGISSFPVRSIEWFRAHARQFDRVLYQFGNSAFHQHMFALHNEHPGVVVLHDFFLSGIAAHMEMAQPNDRSWVRSLYDSHGYHAVHERFHTADTANVAWKYPCNADVLRNAPGIIVHSEAPIQLARHWYGPQADQDWACIPLSRTPATIDPATRKNARKALDLNEDHYLVCGFGLLGPAKLNHRLLDAWLASPLASDPGCMLVFVGGYSDQEYSDSLLKSIKRSSCADRVRVTGWASGETFRQYLSAADCAVQLRNLSRGETSAAVLDCMNYGIATIVNAHGSMTELPDDGVWKLSDTFTDAELANALGTLREDAGRRQTLGLRARKIVLARHDPRTCAGQYFSAIERFHPKARTSVHALASHITRDLPSAIPTSDLAAVADTISRSVLPLPRQRQILIDVSTIVLEDLMTGIQRVVRSILLEWLLNPPPAYRIEPVYANATSGYRYARDFTLRYLDCKTEGLQDDPIEYYPGDIFLALDFHMTATTSRRTTLAAMRRAGVDVKFVIAVYTESTCLVAASEDEDFGLTQIEAAQHRLPIIARDIPVFREIAGEHAWYYEGETPECLSAALVDWLNLHARDKHPGSGEIPRLTWEQSARQLLDHLLGQDHDASDTATSKQKFILARTATT